MSNPYDQAYTPEEMAMPEDMRKVAAEHRMSDERKAIADAIWRGDASILAAKMFDYIQQENKVLHARVRQLEISLSSEREACAKVAEDLAANTPQLLLHSGEMEPQELLTSKAVLKLVASLIRGREKA